MSLPGGSLASPPTGLRVVELKIFPNPLAQIEQKGFLTLFNDVNGYGDWSRRWTCLRGNFLHFWKYPEDESKMDPCHQINLSTCVTSNVTLAPSEVSSRMHTIMLETRRRTVKGDQDSLVMHVVRFLANVNSGYLLIHVADPQ